MKNKAVGLFQVLGEYLPKEVFDRLTVPEMERLLTKIGETKKPNPKEETLILANFLESLQKKSKTSLPGSFLKNRETTESSLLDEEAENLFRELESMVLDPKAEFNPLEELYRMPKELLQKLAQGEDVQTIARILCFSHPDEAAGLLETYPESKREEIIWEIGELEPNSLQERDRLVRFLGFKLHVLGEGGSVDRIKNKSLRTAGEILAKLSPASSEKILGKLERKNPEYAETLREHTFFLEDILALNREDLELFLEEVHPVILAYAFKIIELEKKENFFNKINPWYRNQVILELESIGSVTLREVEEAQKGLVEILQRIVEEGKLQIRRKK